MLPDPPELGDLGPGPYLFLSPHLDDVALSCSALVAELSQRGKVVVLTAFTAAAPGPQTLSARAFLRQCGYADPHRLYADRRAEDVEALDALGVEHRHLGLADALFRSRPGASRWFAAGPAELRRTYPTYRFQISRGVVSRHDGDTVAAVTAAVAAATSEWAPDVVIAPMGIGGHVDHRIVADVAERLLPDALYYADQPYALTRPADQGLLQRRRLVPLSWNRRPGDKKQILARYRTQMDALFPAGIPELPERYFVPESRLVSA